MNITGPTLADHYPLAGYGADHPLYYRRIRHPLFNVGAKLCRCEFSQTMGMGPDQFVTFYAVIMAGIIGGPFS